MRTKATHDFYIRIIKRYDSLLELKEEFEEKARRQGSLLRPDQVSEYGKICILIRRYDFAFDARLQSFHWYISAIMQNHYSPRLPYQRRYGGHYGYSNH